jgi:hypothetical protein
MTMNANTITRREMLSLAGSLSVSAVALAAQQAARVAAPGEAKTPGPSPYAARVLSLNPAGYWRLGEAKGPTAADRSGRRRDGVYHGSPGFHLPGAIKDDPDHAVGLKGKSYVEIPNDKEFSVSKTGLTVEVWLQLAALDFPGQSGAGNDPYVHWLGKGTKDQFEWGFRLYSKHKKDGRLSSRPNRISAYIWNPKSTGAGENEGAGAYFEDALTPGRWMHVVAVYEPPGPGAGVRIFRDGVLRKGPPDKGTLYSTFKVTPVHGSAPVRLGTRDLGSFLDGALDEAAIYPRVLTTAEIRENYRIGTQHLATR